MELWLRTALLQLHLISSSIHNYMGPDEFPSLISLKQAHTLEYEQT